MKSFAVSALAALVVVAATAPAYAQSRPAPRPPSTGGGIRDGEAGYKLGCAMMWALGYSVCMELPGAPKPQARAKEA